MTHPDDSHELGRLLDHLVPDLPAPADRIGAVGRRVRRRRIRQILLVAACVTLILVSVPTLVAASHRRSVEPPVGPPRPSTAACPARLPTFPFGDGSLPASAPGVLAPSGAVRAVLCRYDPLPEYRISRPGPARQLILSTDVPGLIAVLNQLPSREPLDPCFSGGDGGYLTLMYPNGTSATIELSNGCGFVRRGKITRYQGYDAVRAFDKRYRQQALATAVPAAIAPADCAPRLAPGVAPARLRPDPVFDAWLHGESADGRYLPAPLAIITACRYQQAGHGSLARTKKVLRRGALNQTTDAVEAAHTKIAGEIPFLGCASTAVIRTVDVLVLRDIVGETFEVRVVRDTCPVITFGFDGAPPNAAVSALLDMLLGPPA